VEPQEGPGTPEPHVFAGDPAAGPTPTGWPHDPYQTYPGATPTLGYPMPGPMYQPAAVAPAPPRGRLRVGLAGLAAGAVIGGAAGAGVVVLTDHSATPVSAAGPTQNVVIQNPEKATTATAAAAKAARSVVTVYVTNGSGAGSGSGIVLSADGYVVTNNHVVTLEGSSTGTVQARTADGRLYDATVVGTDPSSDLAVVKLKNASGLTPAAFADSDKVQVGDAAIAIGAPLGLSNTVTEGIISAVGRAVATGSSQSSGTVIEALQTDAAINPGNSGGALLDGAGEVIGINTAIATVASEGLGQDSGQGGNIGVGFAIPSNTAQRVAQEIVKTGKASHAVLGVQARTLTAGNNPDAGNGAQVVQVVPDGPAAKAGMQTGDVITAVGTRPVTTSTELTAAVRSEPPASDVTLTIRRGNQTQTVKVTLGSTTS
jgi:putative serine protease PepD